MAGKKLRDIGFTCEVIPEHVSVKEAVFPFIKFPGVDVLLGPEMKSTGEVMGVDSEFGPAFLKSQYSTDFPIPSSGKVFLSVADSEEQCRDRGPQTDRVRVQSCVHRRDVRCHSAGGVARGDGGQGSSRGATRCDGPDS